MAQLDHIFLNCNVYSKTYKMLGEFQREEYQRRADFKIPNPTVNMIFTRDRNRDRRCYDISNVNEIAMIFNNTDGETPFERDFLYILKIKNFLS